jgi:predicted phage baseplate assembly protein
MFAPFGSAPAQGDAFWLGLAGETAPTNSITLGFEAAAMSSVPDPVVSGGAAPPTLLPPPLLRWELLDGTRLTRLEVVLDETASLQQSGVVELRLPKHWRTGRPGILQAPPELRWLRVRIVHGSYQKPPQVAAVRLNVVGAEATRTVRDESLERLPADPDDRRVRMRLTQTPVVPGSLEVEVDTIATGDVFGTGAGDEATLWTEVADLAAYGADSTVFTLDPEEGIVTFGDGRNGRVVPEGFRNVRARRYRVGGGKAGAILAEASPAMLVSIPFLRGVENPAAATGGVDTETDAVAVRRGPQELRARGRAVALADYGLMAIRALGAEVARAYAVRGLHPSYRGAPIPGLVGVFVVPPDRDGSVPIADPQTLRAVADYLTSEVAPAGVQIVAAAPRFHMVGVEARLVFTAGTDVGIGIGAALATVDDYLHPLRGGDDGEGWPPGGELLVIPTTRRLLARVPGLQAVPQLNFVLDGVRQPPCTDVPITTHSLVWPANHELVPIESEVPQ